MKKIVYILLLIIGSVNAQIINSYAYATAGATELYDFADAMDYTNESNTIKTANTGFGYWANSNTLITSTTEVTPYNGTYCGKIAPTSAGSNYRSEMRLNVTAGDTYTIKVWAKAGAGTNQIAYWANFSIAVTNVTGDWTEYVFNVTAATTGTAFCRFYPQFSSAVGTEYMYVDNISIIKTN